MRIAAGKFRGRNLIAPKGLTVRPTGGRVREALFDILLHGLDVPIEGALVLDVFAGAGALGLEALSRGAREAIFIEQAKPSLDAIAANIDALNIAGAARIVRADATDLPRAQADAVASLVFMDPPYRRELAVAAIISLAAQGWLAPGAILAVEHDAAETIDPPIGFSERAARRYGATGLLFLRFGG